MVRADQIAWAADDTAGAPDYLVPIVADAEAGFGGVLNTYEVVTQLIEAGAAGIHLEDQSSADRRCGLMAGKILVPIAEFVDKLVAARLAADVAGAPTVIIARTDALQATVLTSDADPRDQPYIRGRRAEDGYFDITPGMESAITRGLAYAPYADLLWCESMRPDLADAEAFAAGIHREFPGKPLAFNCTIGPDWAHGRSASDIESFQQRAAELGYRYQFITIAGFHSLNAAAFELAAGYHDDGMAPYVKLLDRERELAARGFTAVDFQNEVGAAHYEAIGDVVRDARRSRAEGAATRR
jgi:isocitrate lyase